MLDTFRSLDWRTQIAIVLSGAAAIGGGTAGVSQLWKPDPAVAEMRGILEEHRNEAREINASVLTKLDSLVTNGNKQSDAMFYNICEDSRESEWLVRLGRRGASYCESITSNIEREFARGAYR